jgi:hypothetical protein
MSNQAGGEIQDRNCHSPDEPGSPAVCDPVAEREITARRRAITKKMQRPKELHFQIPKPTINLFCQLSLSPTELSERQ